MADWNQLPDSAHGSALSFLNEMDGACGTLRVLGMAPSLRRALASQDRSLC